MMKNSNLENLMRAIVGLIMIIVFFVLSVLFGLLLQLSAENPQKFKEIIMTVDGIRYQLSKGLAIFSIAIALVIWLYMLYMLFKYKKLKNNEKKSDERLE